MNLKSLNIILSVAVVVLGIILSYQMFVSKQNVPTGPVVNNQADQKAVIAPSISEPTASAPTGMAVTPHDRDAQRLIDLRQYSVALELYHAAHGNYPDGEDLRLGSDQHECLNDHGWQSRGCAVPFMGLTPKDPSEGSAYIYTKTPEGFAIEVQLEGTVETSDNGTLSGKITLTPTGIK